MIFERNATKPVQTFLRRVKIAQTFNNKLL